MVEKKYKKCENTAFYQALTNFEPMFFFSTH